MKYPRLVYPHRGLTLIEIMIAMLLGIFLIGGVVQIFLSSKQTYRMQENLSRIQENGRFAMDFIARDLRMAGDRECVEFTIPVPVTGSNNIVAVLPAIAGTDTITIQRSTANGCSIPITATPVTTITYAIRSGAGGRPSLFRNDGVNNTELVEGVEDMQVTYGDDGITTNFTPDFYGTAATVNMTGVVSVRISLLVSSPENNVASVPLPYVYNNVTITPPANDKRIRRVFTSTIALRNRLP